MGKLIRTNLPTMMVGEPITNSVSEHALEQLLISKLQEETQEVIQAILTGDIESISEEIGDVEAVLNAMIKHFNIDYNTHKSQTSLKTAQRGEFLDENNKGLYWGGKFKGDE